MVESNAHRPAIVTGGSSGIGRGIAERLARDGYSVIVNYAGRADAADDTVQTIMAAGGQAKAIRADVSRPGDVKRLFDEAEASFGQVHVVANNAGRALRKPLAEFTEEEYDAIMDTNLKGVFLVMAEAARRLVDGGRIVNTSASFHGAPIPGYSVYAASKWAVEKMTEVAAKELGARGIRVNAIRPGPTDTPLFRAGKDDAVVKKFASMAALDRIGTPEDIAAVVSFLVGPDSEWVTAQVIGANGGFW